jgi:hypothetical protein
MIVCNRYFKRRILFRYTIYNAEEDVQIHATAIKKITYTFLLNIKRA